MWTSAMQSVRSLVLIKIRTAWSTDSKNAVLSSSNSSRVWDIVLVGILGKVTWGRVTWEKVSNILQKGSGCRVGPTVLSGGL